MSKLSLLAAGAAAACLMAVAPAHAQSVVTGNIAIIAADPQDFVVEMDKAGPCGSKYFHIQRANANFKEMVALSMTAFASNKYMVMFVTSCGGDRNIISHGYTGK